MQNALKMVRERVAESIGLEEDEVNAKSQFRELVDDSLELANLCLDLEELTGIDADEIANIGSVGALAARLNDSNSDTGRFGRRN
jgi:acyl carrier protein